MDNRPIGFLDSGVGGLTVVRELLRQLPHEDVVYIGDSARAPYGPRPADQIREYTWQMVNFLLTKNVKMIVLACNTATAVVWEEVKEKLDIPVLSLAPDMEVSSLACPKFVPLVESNELASSVTKKVVYETLKPLVGKVDTLVLGCTHYPLLKPIIQNVMGPDVKLIDSGAECVRDISVLLNYFELNKSRELLEQTYRFYTTANANSFAAIAEKWLERSVNVEHVNL